MTRRTACLAVSLFLTATSLCPAGEHPPQRTTFHGRSLEEWSTGLYVPDARVRSRAATALGLGRFGKPAVPPLLHALKDEYEEVRRSALIALGNLGPDAADAIPALVPLLAVSDEETKKLAGAALTRIGPAAIPVLLAELRSNGAAGEALRILGTLGRPAVPGLVLMVGVSSEWVVAALPLAAGGAGAEAAPLHYFVRRHSVH